MKHTITFKTGTEGPKGDPYAFQEIRANGWTLHSGLSTTLTNPKGAEVHARNLNEEEALYNQFLHATGLTQKQVDRAYAAHNRRLDEEYNDPMGHPSQYI